MKIDPTASLRAAKTRPAGRVRNREGGDFAGALASGERAGGVQGASGVASIDALVALQGVGDSMDEEREAFAYGEDLLDGLDALRLDLLTGCIPLSRLEALQTQLKRRAARHGAACDGRLLGVLAEIETRVAVELAKLGR